jgi:hypothetical protein
MEGLDRPLSALQRRRRPLVRRRRVSMGREEGRTSVMVNAGEFRFYEHATSCYFSVIMCEGGYYMLLRNLPGADVIEQSC